MQKVSERTDALKTIIRTELELREGRVAVCDTLDPLGLVGFAVKGETTPGAV